MGGTPRLRRAFDSPDAKRAYNQRLFSTIAPRYDLITRLLSYGQDARWKRRVAEIVGEHAAPELKLRPTAPELKLRPTAHRPTALDLACGTGDVAALVARTHDVVGLDLALPMLRLARGRDAGARWIAGDMTELPFASASFDVVTTSYGLRNVPVLERALHEIARVLRQGGLLVSLDFNKPDVAAVRAIYLGYLTITGAALGLVLHGDSETYRYIPHSIRRYPGAHGVAAAMRDAGFRDVRIEPKLGGLMTIHAAIR